MSKSNNEMIYCIFIFGLPVHTLAHSRWLLCEWHKKNSQKIKRLLMPSTENVCNPTGCKKDWREIHHQTRLPYRSERPLFPHRHNVTVLGAPEICVTDSPETSRR